ncbi:MAG: hypothetical protein HWD59_01935 [Coxiellaceae bacterium]|nr:MAG: hypothetical protein HWD59_01935 [Coxiellaceae bacterium]
MSKNAIIFVKNFTDDLININLKKIQKIKQKTINSTVLEIDLKELSSQIHETHTKILTLLYSNNGQHKTPIKTTKASLTNEPMQTITMPITAVPKPVFSWLNGVIKSTDFYILEIENLTNTFLLLNANGLLMGKSNDEKLPILLESTVEYPASANAKKATLIIGVLYEDYHKREEKLPDLSGIKIDLAAEASEIALIKQDIFLKRQRGMSNTNPKMEETTTKNSHVHKAIHLVINKKRGGSSWQKALKIFIHFSNAVLYICMAC